MSGYQNNFMPPTGGPPRMPMASQFTPGPNWPKPHGDTIHNPLHVPPPHRPNAPTPTNKAQNPKPQPRHQQHPQHRFQRPKPKNENPHHQTHYVPPQFPAHMAPTNQQEDSADSNARRRRSRSAHVKDPVPQAVAPGEITLEGLRHLIDDVPEVILIKLRFENIGFWEMVNRTKGYLDDEAVILVVLAVHKALQCRQYRENLETLVVQLTRSHLVRLRLPHCLRRQLTYKVQKERFQMVLLEALVGFFKACLEFNRKDFEKNIGPSLILTKEAVKQQMVVGHKFKQQNVWDLMTMISDHNIPDNCADFFKIERYPGVPETLVQETPPVQAPVKNVNEEVKTEKVVKPTLPKAVPAEKQPKMKMPNSPFRRMDLVPSLKDLTEVISGSSMLQNTRLDTRFNSTEEYLESHFRFLRYELLAPLKEVIAQVKSAGELLKLMPNAVVPETSVPHAYPGTVIANMELTSFGVLCTLSVRMEFIQNIKWSYSNNFLSGSLLCLSHNEFKTGLWASVVRRDVAQLKKGFLKVWILQPERSFRSLAKGREYVMIENCQHFEAVEKILAGMQSQNNFWAPLERVIVNGNCNVGLPSYLESLGGDVKFQLRPAYPAINWSLIPGMGFVTMKEFPSWPHRSKLELDDAQYEALYDALTKQVSVISGASGTGKKYLASKIGQILVHGSSLKMFSFDGPLVFICDSNVALDHFIQTLQKSGLREIIRFGGESKEDSTLHGCNFYEIKAARKAAKQANVKKDSVARREAKRSAAKIIELQKTINRCNSGILGSKVSLIFGNDLQHHENGQRALCHWLLEGTSRVSVASKPTAAARADVSIETDAVGNVEEEIRLIHGEMTRYEPYIKMNFEKEESEETEDKDSWNSIQGLLSQQMAIDDVMTTEEENKIDSIWNLAPTDRWRLYRKRVNDLKNISETCLKEHFVAYTKSLEQLRTYKIQSQVDFLKKYKVVALTVTGAVKFLPTLQALEPSVLLVQEAGAVPEELLVSVMTKECQHLIMIGDLTQQWPRLTSSKSLFERLVSEKGFQCKQLNVQHSMSISTMRLLNLQRSKDIVRSHSSVLNMKPVKGMDRDVFFLAHNNKDESLSREDEKNSFEAEYSAALCRYLLMQGYTDKSIAILATTIGQVMAIRSYLGDINNEVDVCLIDHWQGQRSDIVIVSMVRSGQEEADMSIVEKRFQLAFTRARIGIYCFVNVNYLARNAALWQPFLSFLNHENLIGNEFRIKCENHPTIRAEITCPQDFTMKAPNGGCNLSCIRKMSCGHLCGLSCHSYDMNHEKAVLACKEPCMKKICLSGHTCQKMCSEECNACQEVINVKLARCGHTASVRCNENFLQLKCNQPCPRKPFSCEHSCPNKCGEECPKHCAEERVVVGHCGHAITVPCHSAEDPYEIRSICTQKCTTRLPCGHLCSGTCGKCFKGHLHQRCQEKCKLVIPLCGHVCDAPCHQQCPPCRKPCEAKCPHGLCKKLCGMPCEPCQEPCPRNCPHSKCTKKCGEPCDKLPCDVPCTKPSEGCQHPCVGLCGEVCPPNCGFCSRGPEYVNVFGTENNFARYIYLKGCGHVLEVTGMDRWMTKTESNLSTRMDKGCPACFDPIYQSVRYHNYTNNAIQNLISAKVVAFGNPMLLKAEKASLLKRIIVHRESFSQTVAKIVSVLESDVSQFELSFVREIIDIVSEMKNLLASLSLSANMHQASALREKVFAMQDMIIQMMDVEEINGFSVVNFGSHSELDKLRLEVSRINCLRYLYECAPKNSTSINQKAKPLYDATLAFLTSGRGFTSRGEEVVKKAVALIKQLERPLLSYLVKDIDILHLMKLFDSMKLQYEEK